MSRKMLFLVSLVLLGCVVVSSTASAGLIGWWKFDEGSGTVAKDASGKGNDGTIAGTATWVAGVKGGTDGAISLDGKTAYVVIDGVAKSMPANNNFTISAWMKTTATAGYVIAANDSGGSHAFWFGPASNGNLQVQADTTTNYPPKVNDDKWHMITYVRDGTKAYVYIDGVQVGTETPTASPATQTRWSIGQEWDPPDPSDFYAGAVDDVRIYDKPADAAQVKELFLKGTNPIWAKAALPDPKNGALGVTMPMFQWVAGEGAVAHNVYVGISAELTAANLVGPKQPMPMYFYVPGLEPGVTYYWRVDEIDAAGKVATGDVWSFQALPLTAWGPQPADGAKNVVPSQTLSWSAGQGATQHQVFFSRNPFEVVLGAAAADKGKTAETKLATGQLALKTTYYWRVDEIQADGKALKGPVWSFRTADALDIRVASGADDMEERTATGLPDSGSSDLEMPYESAGTTIGTTPQVTGLRFAVPLAKGTVITKAYVQFTMDEPKGGTQPVNLVIDGQLEPNAPAFTTAAKDVSGRAPRTKAQVKWSAESVPLPAGASAGTDISSQGIKLKTADLSAVLSEIIGQAGWASGNSLVLIFADDKDNPSTGVRCVDAAESGANYAPVLHIEVFTDQAPAPAALDVRIASAGDDAEQYALTGQMNPGSKSLELAYETAGNPAKDEQLVGLRFTAPIPKGAQVTKAYLEFKVASISKAGTANPVNLVIAGQLTPNAPVITAVDKNLSSRRPWTTETVKWSVPAWTKTNEKFQTPDLSALLQEIINQNGWAADNALLLLLRDDKDKPSIGLREAEAFEGDATAAPLLHLEVLWPE